jgi:hypothetical protein
MAELLRDVPLIGEEMGLAGKKTEMEPHHLQTPKGMEDK